MSPIELKDVDEVVMAMKEQNKLEALSCFKMDQNYPSNLMSLNTKNIISHPNTRPNPSPEPVQDESVNQSKNWPSLYFS